MNLLRKITPRFLLSWYHLLLAFIAAFLYGFPSRKLVVIGVTGTNGKSTVVEMISRILEEGGKKTASLSSVRFRIKDKEERNTLKMTMPGRFFVQRFLRQAVNAGCTHAVLEVTSEGILQHRHRFIYFHTAALTNLSPEHIERHGSFEKYREAKSKLFQAARDVHVINLDDEQAEYFLQIGALAVFGYRIPNLQLRAPVARTAGIYVLEGTVAEEQRDGMRFSVDGNDIRLKLHGAFNASNALAAIAVALSQGLDFETCTQALEQIEKMPGRMELVAQEPFEVFVDYAFTPAALEKVYKILSSRLNARVPRGKLLCVLGAAGGGRDTWKRPALGKLAGTYCDAVIVTNEDPYDEDPQAIIDQVAQGAAGKAEKIFDRREAIASAFQRAGVNDIVVITGKGSEDSIAGPGGKKTPWDDRVAAKEELDKVVQMR